MQALESGGGRRASETAAWLRPWVALAVLVLSVITVATAFAEDMPARHRVAAPIAVGIMLAGWAIELWLSTRASRPIGQAAGSEGSARLGQSSTGPGQRAWTRTALIAAVIVPNVWLTLEGHASTNYLFLLLLVAWVGLVGSWAESVASVVLALGTVALGIATALSEGQFGWSGWISTSIVLLMGWLMALVLRRQERLAWDMGVLRGEAEQRSQELGMLLSVSRSVASRLEMQPLMDAVLDALGNVVTYSGTAILTLTEAGDELTFAHWRGPESFGSQTAQRLRHPVRDFGDFWQRLAHEEPVIIGDVRDSSQAAETFRRLVGEGDVDTTYGFIRSLMWVPMVVQSRMLGIMSVANSEPGAFDERDATLALGIARQAALGIENARLHQRARDAAVLEERQRLARELHDSVTQGLYGVSLYAEAAARALADGDTQPAVANLRDIRETTQEALGEMRLLLFELRPPVLEEHGLAAALRARLPAVEERAGLEVEFECQGQERLPADKEQELYRLAQEALNNVLKHAHARRVRVGLDLSPTRASLEVADDGVGFEPRFLNGAGYGLRGMRERAERLGGELSIDSTPGAGTRVRVEVPR